MRTVFHFIIRPRTFLKYCRIDHCVISPLAQIFFIQIVLAYNQHCKILGKIFIINKEFYFLLFVLELITTTSPPKSSLNVPVKSSNEPTSTTNHAELSSVNILKINIIFVVKSLTRIFGYKKVVKIVYFFGYKKVEYL